MREGGEEERRRRGEKEKRRRGEEERNRRCASFNSLSEAWKH
jgi:hypothetical protein